MDVCLQPTVEQHSFRFRKQLVKLTKTLEAVPSQIEYRALTPVLLDKPFRMADNVTGLVFKRDFPRGRAAPDLVGECLRKFGPYSEAERETESQGRYSANESSFHMFPYTTRPS
jgi:hypothetical protein